MIRYGRPCLRKNCSSAAQICWLMTRECSASSRRLGVAMKKMPWPRISQFAFGDLVLDGVDRDGGVAVEAHGVVLDDDGGFAGEEIGDLRGDLGRSGLLGGFQVVDFVQRTAQPHVDLPAQREPPRPQAEKRRPEFRMPGPQSVDADQGAQADDHQYRQRPQVNGQGKIQHPVDDGHQGYGEAQHPAYEGQRMPDTVFFHNTIGLVRSWSPTKIVKIPQNPQSGPLPLPPARESLPARRQRGRSFLPVSGLFGQRPFDHDREMV